ncbi:MAG TPA: TonB-dependent receptor [Kofleriaceae bacterium]|nr:TonB-dependent receptor [Kofleriaceae bacterium]
MAAALAFGAGSLVATQDVFADASSTEGSLRGQIRDKAANEPAIGATVVATSPALQGEQVVITDDTGQYFITALPPGVYTLTVYYNDVTYSRGNVLVQVGKEVVVNVSVNTADTAGKPKGEVINISGAAPIIDQGSTKTGVTIGDDYTRNVPVGRTFGEVVGASAGSQGDEYGTGFSGATSVENTYVVEGINTTDTAFGALSTNLPNEFVSETEVITGGYAAEYGRATGGLINVATKQGSNEFHGSVFGNFSPDSLTAAAKTVVSANSIDYQTNPGNNYDFGAEVGGPIIKDKLWFHVGFDPTFSNTNTKRFVGYETDDGTGNAKLDSNGNPIKTNITSQNISTAQQTYFFTAKINGAIDQNNQFQISAFGNPEKGDAPINPGALTPSQDATIGTKLGAWDVAAKWTSKLNQGKTQIDAIVGFHRAYVDNQPNTTLGAEPSVEYAYTRSLADFADLEGTQVANACQDAAASNFIKCPVTNYQDSGNGEVEDRINDRLTAALTVTQRVKFAGYHTFKAGVDYEGSSYDTRKSYTGGAFYEGLQPAGPTAASGLLYLKIQIDHNIRNLTTAEQMNPGAVTLGPDQQLCLANQAVCQAGELAADTDDRSIGAFLQDSWQVIPNLTFNLGVRYENQGIGWASQLQNTTASDGSHIGTQAASLNNWAPRLGFIWDPTNEGKAKIFGHYGWFYENIPMDMNVRSFGGEVDALNFVNGQGLTQGQPGFDANCNVNHTPAGPNNVGAALNKCTDVSPYANFGGDYVAPGLQGQYSQEIILGGEYEVIPDLKVGLNYIHRDLPRVIEDTLVNGGAYDIVNPGENFDSQAAALQKTANAELASNNPATVAQGELDQSRAQGLTTIKNLDTPTRNYDAVQLQVTQRPTKDSLILASYTYSRENGNYPGLFSTETGQLDPNITSEYDLEALLANRYGPTGLDRPHNLKIDGFYRFDFKVGGLLTLGASIRGQSGIPHNILGADPYGQGESYILPRGVEPRSPFSNEEDIHVSYGYRLNKQVTLEVFADIFNLFNQQQEAFEDENYTFDYVHPIVGGDMTDLAHLKQIDQNNTNNALNQTVTTNPNFLKTTSYIQNPRTFRFGFRLTF